MPFSGVYEIISYSFILSLFCRNLIILKDESIIVICVPNDFSKPNENQLDRAAS